MDTQLTTRTNAANAEIMERVLVVGDLAQLTPQERVSYYRKVCESIGLNPLTKPFDYINLNGKLTLYAKKDAADQLRKTNGVSIGKPDIQFVDDLILVTVAATDKTGRADSDVGIVKKGDMRGDMANAVMKAVTKAKRRVTLSLCGLGWLDETEVETIPDAKPVVVVPETGEIVTPTTTQTTGKTVSRTDALAIIKAHGLKANELIAILPANAATDLSAAKSLALAAYSNQKATIADLIRSGDEFKAAIDLAEAQLQPA